MSTITHSSNSVRCVVVWDTNGFLANFLYAKAASEYVNTSSPQVVRSEMEASIA